MNDLHFKSDSALSKGCFTMDWTSRGRWIARIASFAFLALSAAVSAQQTVTLTAPANNSTSPVGTAIGLAASTTGTVNRVRFKQNGTYLGFGDSNPAYEGTYTPTAPGNYVFIAEAMAGGNIVATSAPVTVIVGGGGGGNTAPTISLAANNASLPAPASFGLTASAADSDGSVVDVKFYADGVFLSTDNSPASFTGSYSTSSVGSHVLTAVATDNLGATTTSAPVTVNVTGGGSGGGSGPSSLKRTYVYDNHQRLCKTINPESGASFIAYDDASNILWTADGSSLTGPTCDRDNVPVPDRTYRSYDAMDRLTAVTTPFGQADKSMTYTLDGLVASSTANNTGNVSVTNAYTYNKRRLLAAETVSQPGWYTWSVGYAYDANGHLSTLTYPNTLWVAYAPNALGQPTQVGSFASGVSYYPNGAIKQFTYGNGIVHTMTPNMRGLPSRSRDMNGSTPVLDDSYSFDANANVSVITDLAQGTARGMAYDGLDRLTTAVSTDTPSVPMWGTAQYTYDTLDNLRSSTLGAAGYSYNYDANNRLATLARTGGGLYTYLTDSRGNISGDGRQTYTWDSANRLYGVEGKEYYRYDSQGRRVLSWHPTHISLFMYSHSGQVLFVSDGLRQQDTANIYLGNTLLAARSQSWSGGGPISVRYQHTDALGSPVATTDENRTVAERTVYAPYGAPVNRPVEGVGYTGHVLDQSTGLTYMQQRYYDPAIGRFLSIDPMDTETTFAGNFNRYAYAKNNPYSFVDPDGRCTTPTGRGWCVDLASSMTTAEREMVQGAGTEEWPSGIAVLEGRRVSADKKTTVYWFSPREEMTDTETRIIFRMSGYEGAETVRIDKDARELAMEMYRHMDRYRGGWEQLQGIAGGGIGGKGGKVQQAHALIQDIVKNASNAPLHRMNYAEKYADMGAGPVGVNADRFRTNYTDWLHGHGNGL